METNYSQLNLEQMQVVLERLRAQYVRVRMMLYEGVTHVTLHTPTHSESIGLLDAKAQPEWEAADVLDTQIERLKQDIEQERERANIERMENEDIAAGISIAGKYTRPTV